ncbi:MAG: accessory factor UbiK family protein [Gammaproteobacteria bacterium]|nr:accessory factor UbiK family protein [Gammaproteobacteria bacterium]
MIDPKLFDDMASKFSNSLPPSLLNFREDLQRNFKTILQNSFSKLNLVSREEFDIQTKVLARTREKLEALEKKISALEAGFPTSLE